MLKINYNKLIRKEKQARADKKKEIEYCTKESKKLIKYYSKFRNFGFNCFGDFRYFGYPQEEFSIVNYYWQLEKMKKNLDKCLKNEYEIAEKVEE